jgi:predicted DNA-binding transcriptional regulator YafY
VTDDTERKSRSRAEIAQQKRLELIDFRLAWEGRVNRADLVNTFGISVPQATIDLNRYQELHPDNVEYDRSKKEYAPKSTFEPAYATSGIDALFGLAHERAAKREPSPSPADWLPSVASVPLPRRKRPDDILKGIIGAMRNKAGVEVTYQSMTSPQGSIRVITPHTLVETNGRWHVRAYCHSRDDFRDFVISRFSKIHGEKPSGKFQTDDDDWNTVRELQFVPLPELETDQRNAVAEDYDMTDGALKVPCRRALTFYALQALGVELRSDGRALSPLLELTNISEFNEHQIPKHDWLERMGSKGQAS